MKESRRYKRFIVEDMDVTGKMMFATDVKIIDLSIGGVSLKADRRLNIGSEYTLKMEDKDSTISLKGTVVWSSISENKQGPKGEVIPIYTAGLKFTNVLNEGLLELINFIEGHKKGNEQRLIGLRFMINTPDKAILNFPETYKVKKISLSGMLIESIQALEPEKRLPMEISISEDKPVRFLGRVVSCDQISDRERECYEIGIEFIDMSENNKERLMEFILLLNNMDDGTLFK